MALAGTKDHRLPTTDPQPSLLLRLTEGNSLRVHIGL
jgi:hypothetical protein